MTVMTEPIAPDLGAAVNALANTWDGHTMFDVGGRFTCTEAEALAEVFRASGNTATADLWIEAHAEGDEECDDLHHDLFLKSDEGTITGHSCEENQ